MSEIKFMNQIKMTTPPTEPEHVARLKDLPAAGEGGAGATLGFAKVFYTADDAQPMVAGRGLLFSIKTPFADIITGFVLLRGVLIATENHELRNICSFDIMLNGIPPDGVYAMTWTGMALFENPVNCKSRFRRSNSPCECKIKFQKHRHTL